MKTRMPVAQKNAGTTYCGGYATNPMQLLQQRAVNGSRTVQRMAVNMQSDDDVVNQLVNYARNSLGMTEEVLDDFAEKTLGTAENLYLFGHGGNSSITMEEHDLFAGADMASLADRIIGSITFPEGYTGAVFLAGCKTDSLVGQLKGLLDAHYNMDINVRGTYEILFVNKQDNSVWQRNPPANDDERKLRNCNSILKESLGMFAEGKTKANTALELFKGITDNESERNAVLAAIRVHAGLKKDIETIDGLIGRIDPETDSPALRGKLQGLKQIADVFDELKVHMETLYASIDNYIKLCEIAKQEDVPEDNPIKIQGELTNMKKSLRSLKSDITFQINITAIVINAIEDVNSAALFSFTAKKPKPKPQKQAGCCIIL